MYAFIDYLKDNLWIAGFLSVAVAVGAALYTVSSQRAINRRRATVDMLSDKIWDEDYIKASDCFYHILHEQRKLMEYYDLFTECRAAKKTGKWDQLPESERKKYTPAVDTIEKVRLILNDRELIAIGIRQGTYDEIIYRRWWYNTFLQEWAKSVPLIMRIRSDVNASAYEEMEALAKRWQAEGPWTRTDTHFRLFGRTITISNSR